MATTLAPKETTLRPYQAVLADRMQRAPHHVLQRAPTGSGKTTLLVTHLARNLGVRFTHALLAVPQEQIEKGFALLQNMLVKWPGGLAAESTIEVPDGFIVRAREGRDGSRAQILRYLDDPDPGYVLATTHAALSGFATEDWNRVRPDLRRLALVVDECHHATIDPEATRLSDFVSRWDERGGLLIYATATEGRADGRIVRRPNMTVLSRSLPQHMAEGYAPGTLESELVLVDGPKRRKNGMIEAELGPTASDRAVAKTLVRTWLRDGKPKLTVRMPPRRGGTSGLVREVVKAFRRAGARVLDATGETVAQQREFIDSITHGRERAHSTSVIDVVVGIARVAEGTDWPVCSAVYSIGIPSSLPFLCQLIGRAFRQKGADYPAEYRDRARIVLFVRADAARSLDDLSLDHSRHVALVSVYLADCELGAEWIVVRQAQRGIERALGSADVSPRADDACNDVTDLIDPEQRAAAVLAVAAANEVLVADLGRPPTLGEVRDRVEAERRDLPTRVVDQVVVECLASGGNDVVLEALERGVATRLANPRFDPQIRNEMRAVFAEIVDEFRSETLQASPLLVTVRRQIHKLTGNDIVRLATRLRDASRPDLSHPLVLQWADEQLAETGALPKGNGGQVHGHPGETWKDINYCLWSGNRGLTPGGTTLRALLLEHRGVDIGPAGLNLENDVKPILEDFFKRNGRVANRSDGDVPGYPGLTFGALEQALHKGRRELPGGLTLLRVAEQLGMAGKQRRTRLTLARVKMRGDTYLAKYGRWPNRKAGQVEGELEGETWARWEWALQNEARGLPKRSSLRAVFTPGCERVSHRSMRLAKQRTLENVKAWMRKHHAETGCMPSERAKPIGLEGTGESWDRVNRWLLKKGSSLVKLATSLGFRNKNRPPDLTPQWLRARVLEHIRATGEKPTRRAGALTGHPDECWDNLHAVMVKGGRGLQMLKGTTLAEFVALYCVGNEPLPGTPSTRARGRRAE